MTESRNCTMTIERIYSLIQVSCQVCDSVHCSLSRQTYISKSLLVVMAYHFSCFQHACFNELPFRIQYGVDVDEIDLLSLSLLFIFIFKKGSVAVVLAQQLFPQNGRLQ